MGAKKIIVVGAGFEFGKYKQEARGPWCSAAPQARGLMVWSYSASVEEG